MRKPKISHAELERMHMLKLHKIKDVTLRKRALADARAKAGRTVQTASLCCSVDRLIDSLI